MDRLEAVGSSAALLTSLLHRFERTMSDEGFPVRDHLGAGIPPDDTTRCLAEQGLAAQPEVLAWFAWGNGSDKGFAGLLPESLDGCLDRYVNVTLNAARNPEPGLEGVDWGAPEGWLRLEQDNYGLVIDCSSATDTPEIRRADPLFDPEATPRVFSLCTRIVWAIERIEQGFSVWNAGRGYWENDVSRPVPPDQQFHLGMV